MRKAAAVWVLALAIAAGPIVARAVTPLDPEDEPAAAEIEQRQGSLADRVVKGEELPASNSLVTTPLEEKSITDRVIEQGGRLDYQAADAARREALAGSRGPFTQLRAAWDEKDWYHVGWAAGQIAFWPLVIVIGVMLILNFRGRRSVKPG